MMVGMVRITVREVKSLMTRFRLLVMMMVKASRMLIIILRLVWQISISCLVERFKSSIRSLSVSKSGRYFLVRRLVRISSFLLSEVKKLFITFS